MPDDGQHSGWERIAALIEECRREREACAFIRDHFLAERLRSTTALATDAALRLTGAGASPGSTPDPLKG